MLARPLFPVLVPGVTDLTVGSSRRSVARRAWERFDPRWKSLRLTTSSVTDGELADDLKELERRAARSRPSAADGSSRSSVAGRMHATPPLPRLDRPARRGRRAATRGRDDGSGRPRTAGGKAGSPRRRRRHRRSSSAPRVRCVGDKGDHGPSLAGARRGLADAGRSLGDPPSAGRSGRRVQVPRIRDAAHVVRRPSHTALVRRRFDHDVQSPASLS